MNIPVNLRNPPIQVLHSDLTRVDDETEFQSRCPLCGGILPVCRNQQTMALSREDRCVSCGQMFIYQDKEIAGEPLPALTHN
jgi:predicted RNA-binding Zn-ribbon protein involved in translation (DUF1610 family)